MCVATEEQITQTTITNENLKFRPPSFMVEKATFTGFKHDRP